MVNYEIGAKVGRLTVIRYLQKPVGTRNRRFVECTCECGGSICTRADALGHATLSCGCLNRENTAAKGRANKTHAMTGTRTYRIWAGMWYRCTNPNSAKYDFYKDKTPPEAWKSFETFLDDMGEAPCDLTLERVDNDKPYSKANCKWATPEEQARNKRRTRYVTDNNVTILLNEAASLLGLNPATVKTRIYQLGWSLEKALAPGWDWAAKEFKNDHPAHLVGVPKGRAR